MELFFSPNKSAGISGALNKPFNTKDIVFFGVAVAMYFAMAILANFCRLEIEPTNPLNDFKGVKED